MYDVIVIGAGQAGLSTGYYLAQHKVNYIILDQNERLGDSWRYRYDSLQLFTPRRFNQLPGLEFPGMPDGFPSKNEAADYLEQYAAALDMPIKMNIHVQSISQEHGTFQVHTQEKTLLARNVIIATGPFQQPVIPKFAEAITEDILQLHSSEYHPVMPFHKCRFVC